MGRKQQLLDEAKDELAKMNEYEVGIIRGFVEEDENEFRKFNKNKMMKFVDYKMKSHVFVLNMFKVCPDCEHPVRNNFNINEFMKIKKSKEFVVKPIRLHLFEFLHHLSRIFDHSGSGTISLRSNSWYSK